MFKFSFTERGKFIAIIAAVSAISLIVIIILAIQLISRDIERRNAPVSTFIVVAPETFYPSPEDILDAVPSEPIMDASLALNLEEGVLTFMYTPSVQKVLSDYCTAAIGALMGSPLNTDGAVISVEIPQMANEDSLTLTGGLVKAFTSHNIPLEWITFYVYASDAEAKSQEVKISIG